jgi:hypothetical protein
MRLGRLRHTSARDLVLHGKDDHGRGALKNDRAWANIRAYLLSLSAQHVKSLTFGCYSGCLYGVQPDLIVADISDIEQESIIELKSGAKPSGIRLLLSWANAGYQGAIPDSLLAAHVLQINLQLHARQFLRQHHAGSPVKQSRLFLVYATPSGGNADVFELPARYIIS